MATITFDTYKYIDRLKAAGLSEQQAAEVVAVVTDAHDTLEVATKGDLKDLATKDGLRKVGTGVGCREVDAGNRYWRHCGACHESVSTLTTLPSRADRQITHCLI